MHFGAVALFLSFEVGCCSGFLKKGWQIECVLFMSRLRILPSLVLYPKKGDCKEANLRVEEREM